MEDEVMIPEKYRYISLVVLLIAACGEPDAPFNSVERFRMLGIQAEPPALAEGELAELRALFYAPEGSEVSYKWSWCPLATSPKDGTECLVSEEDLADLVRAYLLETAGADAAAALPDVLPSFDLGEGPTARFVHAVPADLLRQICTQLISDDGIPSFTGIPSCDEKLDVVIRLELTAGGETLYGTKKLPLYIDGERADNENPVIDGLAVTEKETGKAVPEVDGVLSLKEKTHYRLLAELPPDVADTFLPLPTEERPNPIAVRESLFITWYVTGGETEFVRTTFFDGEIPLSELSENFWWIPAQERLPEDDLYLYLVIQDERGGIGWLVRQLTVKERRP